MHGGVHGTMRARGTEHYVLQGGVWEESDLMGRNALVIVHSNLSRWAIRMIHLL